MFNVADLAIVFMQIAAISESSLPSLTLLMEKGIFLEWFALSFGLLFFKEWPPGYAPFLFFLLLLHTAIGRGGRKQQVIQKINMRKCVCVYVKLKCANHYYMELNFSKKCWNWS